MTAYRPRLGLSLGAVIACGVAAPAAAQPVGSEFQVNTYTTQAQRTKDLRGDHSQLVASDAAGNFVVVWTSDSQDGSSSGVFGQRYDAEGLPRGGEFRVNAYTPSTQIQPSVAADADGDFVVVWQGPEISGRRFDSGGNPVGGDFQVNTTAFFNSQPSVASDAAGNFVVAWTSYADPPYYQQIRAQRFDSAGQKIGGEFRVNTYTTGYQYFPSVASDAAGNFVVVWLSSYSDTGYGQWGVFGQRYNAAGTPRGGEFQVNDATVVAPGPPSVASDAVGNFVVAWDYRAIYGQRFDASGVPQGGSFLVDSDGPESVLYPSVASDAVGNFVIAWSNKYGEDGSAKGVFARRYDNLGIPQGGKFQANSYTTGDQAYPSVGATGTDQFVVVWQSVAQDGDREGVFGQRYSFGPSVTVVSPNANARWGIGSRQRIQWTHNLGADATFRIELDRDDDGDYEELIAANAPVDGGAKGSFAWTVTGPPARTARIRVSWTDDPAVSDASDVTFQIRPM